MGYLDVAMEYYVAENRRSLDRCLADVAACDLYVGIFAWRYGWVPPHEDRLRLSITEREYRRAVELDKPRLLFLLDDSAPWPPAMVDDNKARIRRFRADLAADRLPALFSSADTLESALSAALASLPAATRGTAALRPEAATASFANLHQLPSPPADFTGRIEDLDLLRRSAAADGSAAIFGVFGMGGMGKSALALRFAEEMSRQYPDGQIHVDLQGMTTPLSVAQARAQVVRSFLPDAQVPDREAGSAAAYQSVLHGKRVLILLDDAAGREQIEPLLPPRGCALIVTSRFLFTLPGLAAADLDELPAGDARALLLRISPRIGSAAEELAPLCGGLPLALRLAASTLAVRPDLSASAYASRLAEGIERLGPVDAALAASCSLLGGDLRRLWCQLSVFPRTFDAPGAAAIWELEESPAEEALGKLMISSLVDWKEGVARYSLHDLARPFADRQLDEAERQAARHRHATYYLTVLGRANSLCRHWGEEVLKGLRLFDAEWTNIEAGQAWAAAQPESDADATALCDAYGTAGTYCLVLRLAPRQRVRWPEAGLAAARRRQDRTAEAWHLGNLGVAYADLGDSRRAIELHEQCLAIAREIGDLHIEGDALINLALAYAALGENARAIKLYQRRLAMARRTGDHRGEGDCLNNQGLAYAAMGHNHRAIKLYEKRLAMPDETGDGRSRSATLNNLGLAHAALGETGRAIELYERSLAMASEMGDRRGEGNVLDNLALAHAALGEHRRVIELCEQRLALAREYGDRFGEGTALCNLGLAYAELGETGRAIECYEEQLAVAHKAEDRWSEGRASWNLGLIVAGQGDYLRGLKLMQVMVDLEREMGLEDAEQDAAQVDEMRARLQAERSATSGP
jgi:tetratricopeptide (TPR) repeat protein